MISDDAVADLIDHLEDVLAPLDGIRVVARSAGSVTIRLERIERPEHLCELGMEHYYYYKPSQDPDAYVREKAVVGAVIEDARYVFSAYGELHGFHDEGCAGELDVEAHEAPADDQRRGALVAALVTAMRLRVGAARAASASSHPPAYRRTSGERAK